MAGTAYGYSWPVKKTEKLGGITGEDDWEFVLSDGLLTESQTEIPPLCIVNLRAEKRPRLTVDRKLWRKEYLISGSKLWLEREVPPVYILVAAAKLDRSPMEIVVRLLRALGFSLSGSQPDWEAVGPIKQTDRTLISQNLYGEGSWIEREVPLAHIQKT